MSPDAPTMPQFLQKGVEGVNEQSGSKCSGRRKWRSMQISQPTLPVPLDPLLHKHLGTPHSPSNREAKIFVGVHCAKVGVPLSDERGRNKWLKEAIRKHHWLHEEDAVAVSACLCCQLTG